MEPKTIESESFAIIDREAGDHDFSDDQWNIVRRMIHTSADFEYMKSVRFHPEAISAGIRAIRSGKPVFTDTHMAESGIRKTDLAQFGGSVKCLITNPDVAQTAKKEARTRAAVAVETAAGEMDGGIYVIGNAPTALLRLLELVSENKVNVDLVIGLPVGFVNAAESKADLLNCPVPYITNIGRKGGSNVAASVVNALILMASGPV